MDNTYAPTENKEQEKIKVDSIDTIVTVRGDRPYYENMYREVGDNYYHIGYSSYRLDVALEYREKYFELGRFKDLETAKAATEKLSIIKERYWGIVYSPLDEATFKPDVVLIITEPVGGMKLAQTIVYSSGDKVRPNFAGIQSLCGDALANPFITGGVNFTLGCDGSRNAADIKDNEMTIGISGEKLEEVISNLKVIQ